MVKASAACVAVALCCSVLCSTLAESGTADDDPQRRLSRLIGPTLLAWTSPAMDEVTVVDTDVALEKTAVVGVLYSASWCAPCKQFLPVLEELYHRVNRRGKGRFDIVWVSINRDETEIDFLHYFRSMPWLAVPQDQIPLVLENTADVFKLAGIPCLVLLDGTSSSVITLDGRQHVLDDRFGVQFPWRSKSLLNWVSTSVQRKVSGLVTEAKAQVLRALHPRRILLAVRDVLAGAVTLAIELLRSVYSFILNRQNLGSKGLHL